jgi:hypothetical protein
MSVKLHFCLVIFLALFIAAGLNAQVDPGTDNLTHLWTFEDGTADDMIGEAHGNFNGNNIDIFDGDLVTFANESSVGDSWLDLPGELIEFDSYDDITISAWFTPDSVFNTQWNTLWFFGDQEDGQNANDGMALQVRRGDGVARFWFTAGVSPGYSNEDGVNDTTGNYNSNVLYHVVCIINSNSEIWMYHDGVFVDSTMLSENPLTGFIRSIFDISPNFARFCHSTYSGDNAWVGAIHEIAIFNQELSEEEVVFLYEAGVNGFPGATDVKDKNELLPESYSLLQNYPNPFNPSTKISFDLPKESPVKITIYNMLGKEIATVLDEVKPAGRHNVTFNGDNLSSGVYIARMEAGDKVFSTKMTLLK